MVEYWNNGPAKTNAFAKNPNAPFSVIPAKAGIQYF